MRHDVPMETNDLSTLESCNSTWLFDDAAHRFRRILKDGSRNGGVATPWQDFSKVELDDDSDSFSVWLNPEGTRRLRSWRHRSHCEACGGEVTTELNLAAIAALGGR